MVDAINNRKTEHISVIQADAGVDRHKGYFDLIRLRHRGLPQLDLEQIDPSCDFLGKKLSFPLLISSMTGGDDEQLRTINRNLALAAQATGVAMAVGSQRVMFSNSAACASFALRQFAPDILLMANLGAVQLNYGFGSEQAQAAIDCVGADALYLHLNPLQEAVQPEGDTNFSNLDLRIGEVVAAVDRPVILKEVGAGLSPMDIELGLAQGVKYFDLAGCGGTSWSRIEHYRQPQIPERPLGLLFQDWGIPTPEALRLAQPYMGQAQFIASGGLRTGIDMVKSVILGGSLCGMAVPFLKPAMVSVEAVVATIEQVKHEFVTAMFLLGVADISQLRLNNALLLDEQ